MTKVDIISGFLGAGKTTLIKKMILENSFEGKLALIENEFGKISIDGEILKQESDIKVKELNSGCICCSIAGDFTKALKDIVKNYAPDRIIIEPSGVGKISDVIKACDIKEDGIKISMCLTVVDALKYDLYSRNFAEFFINQIKYSKTIILSRTKNIDSNKLQSIVNEIQRINNKANIITTPWEELQGKNILAVAEQDNSVPLKYQIKNDFLKSNISARIHQYKHEHSADEVFETYGIETPKKFTRDELEYILNNLSNEKYGQIIRAKGILQSKLETWLQFDFVENEKEIRDFKADYTGRICIIGKNLNEVALKNLFKL